MSSKELKITLKEAREAIKVKDFPSAIQKCKVSITCSTDSNITQYCDFEFIENISGRRKSLHGLDFVGGCLSRK